MRLRYGLVCVLLCGLTACGGSETEANENSARGNASSGGEDFHPPEDDGIQIEGLMGTLSEAEIQNALQPRMDRFAGCFAARYDDLELVGGDITFSFRIGTDGRVLWVFPSSSTIGDRQTERCLLEQANRARFPEPHGGEAEFTWPIGFDPPGDVRPAANWDGSYVEDAVSQNSSSVRACRAGPTVVTAYVAPGGNVMAAGAAASSHEAAENLDCVTDAVQGWTLPDPGSYPAKVTFEVR